MKMTDPILKWYNDRARMSRKKTTEEKKTKKIKKLKSLRMHMTILRLLSKFNDLRLYSYIL